MEDLKSRIVSGLTGATVVLAVASGVGYVYAYLFEIGFLNKYGIPYQVAHVTTEGFIIFALSALFAMFAVSPFPPTTVWKLLFVMPINTNNPIKTLLLRRLRACFWVEILLLPFILYYQYDLLALLIPPAFLFGDLILELFLDERNIKGLVHKAHAALKRQPTSDERTWAPFSLILAFAIFLAFVSLLLGKYFAQTRENYIVLQDSELVVRAYSDQLLVAQYNPLTNTLTGKYELVSIKDGVLPFRIVHIQELKR